MSQPILSDSRSFEVARLMSELAALPGSEQFSLLTRAFTRWGAGEAHSYYHESVRSFAKSELPGDVNVPADSEEIVITLRGSLGSELHPLDFVEQFRQTVARSAPATPWETRARIPGGAGRDYELTVFMNLATPSALPA